MGRIPLIELGLDNPLFWPTFKEQIASLIFEALLLLRQQNVLVKDEKELNRLLYQCILEANSNFLLPPPAYDAHNPPDPEAKRKEKREDNLPDLYWTLIDHGANYQIWYRTFILECKRLDKKKKSSNWEYTEQYVITGMLRFFLDEKGYGKGCEMGAMVGYIQDMEFDQILEEINSHIATYEPSIPLLSKPVEGWQRQGVSYLIHSFDRSFIPEHFTLQHFWLDMKECIFVEQDSSIIQANRSKKKKYK